MLNPENLHPLCSSPDITLWSYRTRDTRRELEGHTYWRDVTARLSIGDFIFVHHIGYGSAIYCVAPLGQVKQLSEWPPKVTHHHVTIS